MEIRYSRRCLLQLANALLVSAFLISTSGPVVAEKAPPFGLKWGVSPAELEELGIKLSKGSDTEHGRMYALSNLPKVISGSQLVAAYFGYNDKLWRIAWQSTAWPNDPYGNGVQNRYNELKSILRKKYGIGTTQHHTGDRFYSKPENFIYGISRGENWHYTNYQSHGIWVQLGIRASSSDDAILTLIYVNNDLKRNFKKRKDQKEEDAL